MTSLIGKRAFSLIELLVAIIILSVGIITAIQGLSAASRIAALSSDITNANFIIEDKMQEWEFKEKRGLIGAEPPAARENLGRFIWECKLALDQDLGLYRFNSTLSWNRANRKEEISLATYLNNETK